MAAEIHKYTLKEWVRHPTTILLIIVSGVAYGITWIYVKNQLEQVEYLKERVTKLEDQVDRYTNTVMFKDVQIKRQTAVIDSLKGGYHD